MDESPQLLDDILGRLAPLDDDQLKQFAHQVGETVKQYRFVPNPGKQTEAYESQADILLYGGQAGVGKGFLMMGVASQQHKSSIIFRRESTQLDGLEKDGRTIFGDDTTYVGGNEKEWSWADGRSLKLAGMKEPDDWRKHAGRERDFMGFDEAAEFLEEQVASMLGWLRGQTGQRCRMILATNPPRSSDGAWVVKWFAPWLDPAFADPAKPGELRYAFDIGSEKIEWVSADARREVDGMLVPPLSLTFIPAKLRDNPYRNTAEYRARLNSLPEPLRSQLMQGDFNAGVEDDLWQIIPTDWVKQAMGRWTPTPPDGVPMCAIAEDIAQGGTDYTVIASRYDGWYNPLVVIPGKETPNGPSAAAVVIQYRQDNAKIIIDMGGGYGGSCYDHLLENIPRESLVPFKGAESALGRTKDNQLAFVSKIVQAYWKFREALDPSQEGGSPISLPVDPILLSDLTSRRFEVGPNGIKFRSDSTKEAVTKRLGRSPDRGDAVVMAWVDGAKASSDGRTWDEKKRRNKVPNVVRGYDNRRRQA